MQSFDFPIFVIRLFRPPLEKMLSSATKLQASYSDRRDIYPADDGFSFAFGKDRRFSDWLFQNNRAVENHGGYLNPRMQAHSDHVTDLTAGNASDDVSDPVLRSLRLICGRNPE
jgi:hypothetical protein